MANSTPTLKQVLQSCGPDDVITVGTVQWRAEAFLELLIQNNDPRLAENCVEAANGSFTLYAAGMGSLDTTSPAIKAVIHTHK